MKAVIISKPNESYYTEDAVMGSLKPGFARIRVKTCAICATDLAAYSGEIAANYPLILGHEWAGVVEKVADSKYQEWVGKRVTGSNDVTCGHCDACKRGEWRYCPEFKEVGFKLPGAYADYVDVPERGLVELPDNVPFDVACLAEPLGVAFGCLKKAHFKAGQTLTIFGAGPIGLCILVVALSLGAKDVIVIGHSHEERLELAKKLGAHYVCNSSKTDPVAFVRSIHKDGSDQVQECSGAASAYAQAIACARKGGHITLAGYGKGAIIPLRIDDIHINNLKLIGAGNNWNMHPAAVNFLKDHVDLMKQFVSVKLPLRDYQKGWELVKKRENGFIKAVMVIDE